MKSRRTFLKNVSALSAAALLTACGTQTPAQISTEAFTYLQALLNGLQALEPELSTLTGVPAATLASAEAEAATAIAQLKMITSATTTAAATSAFSAFEAGLSSVLAALATYPLPANVKLVVTAASIVLPLIEDALASISASVSAPAPAQLQAVFTLQNAKALLAQH